MPTQTYPPGTVLMRPMLDGLARFAREAGFAFEQPVTKGPRRREHPRHASDVNQLHLRVAQLVKRVEVLLEDVPGFLEFALGEKCAEQFDGGEQPARFDAGIVDGRLGKTRLTLFKPFPVAPRRRPARGALPTGISVARRPSLFAGRER